MQGLKGLVTLTKMTKMDKNLLSRYSLLSCQPHLIVNPKNSFEQRGTRFEGLSDTKKILILSHHNFHKFKFYI